MVLSWNPLSKTSIVTVFLTCLCFAQRDPGVRGGPPGAGGPLPGLTQNELALFNEGRLRATQLEAVCDDCSDVMLGSDTAQDPNLPTLTNSSGLGARFNGDQCTVCQQQPAIGGGPADCWCPILKICPANIANPRTPCLT
jgi:hypothetical protein